MTALVDEIAKIKKEAAKDLLPCPFCGSDNLNATSGDAVFCLNINCGACIEANQDDPFNYEPKELTKIIHAAWNTRLEAAKSSEQVGYTQHEGMKGHYAPINAGAWQDPDLKVLREIRAPIIEALAKLDELMKGRT